MRVLLNVGSEDDRHNDTIYLDPGSTNFSFVTRISLPLAETPLCDPAELAFSADGSKFALGMACGGVSVWDIRSKVPLQPFTESLWPKHVFQHPRFLQFSSGNLGKEILVFVEVSLMFTF